MSAKKEALDKKKNQPKDDEAEGPEQFYLYFGVIQPDSHPLIYSDNYNISFLGLEKLHPFGNQTNSENKKNTTYFSNYF
jgi:hypothetical protein